MVFAGALEIREPRLADASAIAGIYAWHVTNSPATFDLEPPSIETRAAWLEQHRRGRHRALVAVRGERVLGFAASSRFRDRAAYARTVETSVYVDHDHLGEGIGTSLYRALLERLRGEDVHRACAGITIPNDASVALHRRFGFHEVGTFTEQGFKFGHAWDVAWFEREMPGAPP